MRFPCHRMRRCLDARMDKTRVTSVIFTGAYRHSKFHAAERA